MFEHKRETSKPTHLTPDAFAKALEIKQNDNAFPTLLKKLYEDKTPAYDYDAKGNDSHPFKLQIQQLLSAIHTWAEDNKLEPTALQDISRFPKYLFTAAGEKQPPIYFADIKKNLEKILILLQYENIPLLRRKSQLAELAKNLVMCGPGLYRHIESVRQTLASPISFSYWLAEYRTNLIYLFAEKHIAIKKVPEGNAIHAHNAFLLHAAQQGWAPLTNITEIKEHFLKTANVTLEIYKQFENEFLAQYTLGSIANFMTTSFVAEFNRQRKQMIGATDNSSGWIPYDTQLNTLSKALLRNLGLNIEENFFDLETKDGKTFVKFNSQRFKELFLKHCFQKGVLTTSSALDKEPVFKDYDLIHPKDSSLVNIAWIQTKKEGMVTSFDDIPLEEKERYYAYSFCHYQSPDRFHFTAPMPIERYFSTKKSLQTLVKQLEKEDVLIDNVALFKELLRTNSRRLIDGLAVLQLENVAALLDAMEVNYSSLSPQHSLYEEVVLLIDKAVIQGEAKLAELLKNRFRETAAKAKAFKPTYEASIFKQNTILYSDLLKHTDKATEDDQFIYAIYLKHYFPSAVTTSLRPSDAFKKAHEKSILGLDERTQRLFSAAKDGQLKELVDDKMELKELRGCQDQNWNTLAKWAFKTGQQTILDYYYREASKIYPLSPDTINSCHGLYNAPLLHWMVLCHQRLLINIISSFEKLKIDTACSDGETPLHVAARTDDLELAQWLIEKRAGVNCMRKSGATPLYIAAQYGHLDLIKYLLQQRANVNATSEDTTALHVAVHHGHLNVVKFLLQQGADFNATRIDGTTSLHTAAQNSHLAIIKHLLQQQANINVARPDGTTPLCRAAENGDIDLAKYLLQQKSNINAVHTGETTPLYFAALGGQLAMAKYLLQQNADINAICTDSDATPLCMAAYVGHQEIVELLLNQNASLSAGAPAYYEAKTPEIKKLILKAELKELTKRLRSNPSESKEKHSLFSQNPTELKTQQEAITNLLEALDKQITKESLSELLKTHPIMNHAPLKNYYDRVASLAAPKPAVRPTP